MNRIAIGVLAAAAIAVTVPLTAKAYRDYQVYQIDLAPAVPPIGELLRPSYVKGFSHGQIAIMKQFSRIYPTQRIDASPMTSGGKVTTETSPYPQVILSPTECITAMRLGHRVGHTCVPYRL